MRAFLAIACIAGLYREIAIAQPHPASQFDAASIKRSAPDSDTFMKAHPGGRLDISRASLRTLIALAYRVQPFQVSGGPAWVRSEYFSVNTKAVESPSEDRLLLMMQALLAERFSLKLHFETKEQPVYLLVAGKIGKRPPAGLQVTTAGSCASVDSRANACESLIRFLNTSLPQHGSVGTLPDIVAKSRPALARCASRPDRAS